MKIGSTLTLLVPSISALGINCRGSSNCRLQSGGELETIQDKVSQVVARGGRFYGTGEQIACVTNICAFYQNGASGSAQDAFNQLEDLINHGCTVCGSDPTQPGNDVSKGELTVNYVSSPCCGSCACS